MYYVNTAILEKKHAAMNDDCDKAVVAARITFYLMRQYTAD
jgi:hypothetical protein